MIRKKFTAALLIFYLFCLIIIQTCTSESLKLKKPSGHPERQKTESAQVFGKYSPPIQATFTRYIPTVESIEQDLTNNLDGETIDKNRWTELYKDKLGINIKYDWNSKGLDRYQQDINMAIASGEISDFVKVNPIQLKQLAEAGMIMNLSDVYAQWASPLTKYVLTQEGTAPFDIATINGKLMGLPNIDSSMDLAQFVWIRSDWLKELHLSPPKTMGDLIRIAKAFTNEDPDRDGKKDTVGLLMQKDLWGGFAGLEGFFNGFHAYPNIWVADQSGHLVYGSVQPEMKQALGKLQQMFRDGLIDKEFAMKEASQAAETSINGKNGIVFGQQWLCAWPFQVGHDANANMVWKAYPLVSADHQVARPSIQLGTNGWWAVKKGVQHPEALVKMFNLFLEKNWGKTAEFEKYYMPDNAEGIWKLSPVTPTPPFKNLNAYEAILLAAQKGQTSKLAGEPKAIYKKITAYEAGNQKLWSWYAGYSKNGVYRVMKQYKDQNLFVMNKFEGPPTPTMVEKSASLNKLQNEVFTKIILGNAPVSAFDQFVKNWVELGGGAMTQEVNDWYSGRKQQGK